MSILAKKKTERWQINSLVIHLNKLKQEKQTKSKASRGQISTERKKIKKNRKTTKDIDANKSWFFNDQEKRLSRLRMKNGTLPLTCRNVKGHKAKF